MAVSQQQRDVIDELKQRMQARRTTFPSDYVGDEPEQETVVYESQEQKMVWNCCSWFEYILIAVLSVMLLVAVMMLTLFWLIYYRDGFAIGMNAQKQFNFHPALMICGCISISGFAMIFYRLCRCMQHYCIMIFHMLFQMLAISCVFVGFLAAYDAFNQSVPLQAHFKSIHSWLGLITMCMFALQFVAGFFTFFLLACCGYCLKACRDAMVPMHAAFGMVNLMLSIATAVTGLMEMESQSTVLTASSNIIAEHWIIKSIAVILIMIGIVISIVTRRSHSPGTSMVYVSETNDI